MSRDPFESDAERYRMCQGGNDAKLRMLAHKIEKRRCLGVNHDGLDKEIRRLLPAATDDSVIGNAYEVLNDGTGVPADPGGWKKTFEKFVRSRSSIRSFTTDAVPDSVFVEATRVASAAPSVCNRQATRVHVFTGAKAQEIRPLQNGNKGFSNLHTIVVFTSNLTAFQGDGERNQPWFDSGLFAMLFSLSLHDQKVGSCFLNWCVHPDRDDTFHQLTGTPACERVICWMAVGYPSAGALVTPDSPLPVGTILTFH